MILFRYIKFNCTVSRAWKNNAKTKQTNPKPYKTNKLCHFLCIFPDAGGELHTLTKLNIGHAALRGWSLIFYGSKQPIDRNDPVSVPLIPLSTLYNTSTTNNHAANVTKSNGAKGNRKQQQQQSNGSQSSGRKNGKTNGKNGNGKNWKQRLTSPRPQTTLFNKDSNKFEPINGIAFTNKSTTTTVRPKKMSNNNVDNKDGEKTPYIKSPVKAPKQVKEIITPSSSNSGNSNVNTRIDIGNGSMAMTRNLAKFTTTTTSSPLDAHVELVASFQYTSNPNIPKLFQRYEKIQEFYPEFHPYIGLPKASSSLSGSGIGSSVAGKPSRDGSKHSHFLSTSNQQSPSSTSLEMSTSRSNHDASGANKPTTSKTQSSAIISSTNGKG